nr:retrovirus-related Pol polyprotein from transposon TNT 1-94 [Tanacetum cinerariifolium]
MLADAKLPVTFWAEAVNTACYVQNRVLVNKSHNKTPYELFNGRSPAIGFLKRFSCHVMILNTLVNLGKFKGKGDEGTKDAASQEVKKDVSSLRYIALPNWAHDALLEFSSSKPQDHCSTEVPEGSRKPNPTASTSNPPTDQMETLTVETPVPTVSSPITTAYSTDSQEPSSDARLISKGVANQVKTPSLDNILSLTNRFEDILEVTTNSNESNGVKVDISNMETAIIASPTPTLRIYKDHPKRVRPIGTKLVLKNKKDERGIVIKNKARLVAQGHRQEEGIDYDEVFAPVARIEAIRLLLAYASFIGFNVYHMDVKSAFLYNTIDEKVYAMQPPRFQDPKFPAKVYKLEKAIYGLHQAPRAWLSMPYKALSREFSRSILRFLRLIPLGEGSGTPTEPHHIPSPEAQSPSHTTHTSPTLPPVTTTSIPTVTPSDTPIVRQYTRIAQSFVPLTVADEPASPLRDVSQGEACPTDSGFIADQDRATIDNLQRQLSEFAKFQAQEVEINRLKERVKMLEDREGMAATRSEDDAPIKRRSMDEGEAATERISDDLEEMAIVLTSMDAATVLASEVVDVPTGSGSILTASTHDEEQVPTGSKEVMMVSEAPKKQKVQKQIDAQVARELEKQLERGSEKMEDFIPMGSKEEAEKIKRKGLNLEQESAKKQKTSKEVLEEAMSLKEVPEEKVKDMMLLVPIEEVYVEALQVKHLIIDWKVYHEGQRSYWKITKLGGSSASYQPPTSDKEMELWVELSRLYEPDHEDQLWTHIQNFMHAPIEWKLYDTCGVHHVTSKDKEIFMLVEKDYPLRKGLALVMISYKL